MKSKTSIAVIGIGGVGGYFGGKMAWQIEKTNNKDYQIFFVARGSHLKSIKENGLIVNTANQETLICKPQLAIENIDELPSVDIILLAVKSYDLEQVLDQIYSHVTKSTIILPLLNGIDINDRIRKKIKSGIVLPSSVYISSHIEKPGTITHRVGKELIILGPDPKNKNIYPSLLLDAFKLLDINYRWTENVNLAIWEKYIFIASYAMVTALYNKTMGEVFSDYNLKEITRQIMLEIYNIGLAKGISFDEYTVENAMNKARALPQNTKTSYQLDIESKGTKNESNIYAETIIRLSKETGIGAPITIQIFKKIQNLLRGKSALC